MPGLVTVNTPPATSQLTTVATASAEVGNLDPAQNARISGLIDRASAVITNYCGIVFGLRTLTETIRLGWFPGNGPSSQAVAPYGTPLSPARQPLVLSGSQNVSVQVVLENGLDLDPSAPDYEWEAGSGLIYRLRNGVRSWWNVPLVVVCYTNGWLLPNDPGRTLPFDVEDACLALVRSAWFAQGRDPNVAMDALHGDRTQFWDRSVSAMALDDALKAQLSGYVERAF